MLDIISNSFLVTRAPQTTPCGLELPSHCFVVDIGPIRAKSSLLPLRLCVLGSVTS